MVELLDVVVPVGVRKTFAYSVPAGLRDLVATGGRVLVPFGRKTVVGYAVRWSAREVGATFKIRDILDVLDAEPVIPPSLVETALWVAERYFTPPGEVFRVLFPPGSQMTGVREVRLAARSGALLAGGMRPPGLDATQNRALETLARNGPMPIDHLASAVGGRMAVRRIEELAAGGWLEIEAGVKHGRVREKRVLGIRRRPAPPKALESLTAPQRRLYEVLPAQGQALVLRAALRRAGVGSSVSESLSRLSFVDISPIEIPRLPVDLSEVPGRKVVELTGAQQEAYEAVCGMLRRPEATRCLLHGITGSGKTEVYLRLIAEVLRMEATALLLVPEIGLTPLLSRIAVSHFPDRVGLLHSGMSAGERFDQWQRIRSGEARVVVGTRSAVFAPVDNLRLAIIDEEQDPSYKQDEAPFYHAREVAWHRIQSSRGVLLMGSATPSVETYHAAIVSGESELLRLPERIEARPLPSVRFVDMAAEFQRQGRNVVVSEELRAALGRRLERGEQSILLLNRRGYSRSLLCRSCGHVATCPDCAVSLTYHQDARKLLCHYCGVEREVPAVCEECGGRYIYFIGVGTEQLEEILKKAFPTARIARVDRDSTRRKGVLRRILLDFAELRLDILVGTQILAKGHDFPRVTLVGVIAADAGLAFPDFRSAERTFQLLTQVAGRAGRGESPGEVIVQCFYPDHYALRFVRSQDYTAFFQHELEFRRLLHYPPFAALAQVLVTHADSATAFKIAERVAAALKAHSDIGGPGRRVQVLGPALAPLERLRGRYRVQILLKAPGGTWCGPTLSRAFDDLAASRAPVRAIRVDIDPLSLL